MVPRKQPAFSQEDLSTFAEASGDRNPLHLDPHFARRTPFGACVVHGSLLTLRALGCLPAGVLTRVQSIEASFGGALLVGEESAAETRFNDKADAWEVRILGRGRLLARIVTRESRTVELPPHRTGTSLGRTMRAEPLDLDPADMPTGGESVEGIYYSAPALTELAGHLDAQELDRGLLEALAWGSYIVGMELPGLHGVFAAAKLSISDRGEGGHPDGRYSVTVREQDGRTARLLLEGSLAFNDRTRVAALLECFARPPLPPIDADSVLPRRPRQASGSSVVVIGGSRGFGAAASLALLGRGHETHAVFSTDGSGDQLQTGAGVHADRLVLHRADASDPTEMGRLPRVLADRGLPLRGLILAAASPPVPMGLTAESAVSLSDYVGTGTRLFAVPLGALLPLLAEDGFIVFCSSSAVNAPPREWPHYVAAKGAIEGLAGWASTAAPGLRVVVARLPKMLTGMTNSPTMRLGAVAPEVIARRLVDCLEGGDLPRGLTILELDEQ